MNKEKYVFKRFFGSSRGQRLALIVSKLIENIKIVHPTQLRPVSS